MLAKSLLLIFVFGSLNLYAIECVKDPKFYFSNAGNTSVGKVNIANHYKDGECNLRFSMSRVTEDGQKIEEQLTFSDHGKILSFVGSGETFSTSNNSRATGSRAYYLLPRKKENISYTVSDNGIITVEMANGEKAVINSKTGSLEELTNTKWKRNRALRSYVRKGKVIAQDVYADNCINCSLKYKVKYDSFKYSKGGLVINGVTNGLVMSTPFRRGGDARLPTIWGKSIKGKFIDSSGKGCSIDNKFLYDYTYEHLGKRRSIDKIAFKFASDQSKTKTRIGEENIEEFLKRVCIKQKKIKGYDLDFFTAKNLCDHCPTTVSEAAPKVITPSIKKLFDHIKVNKQNVQKGAFKNIEYANRLLQKEEAKGNSCRIEKGKIYVRVFCEN